MGQFNLWTYVSITDIVEKPLIEIFHATWHSILFLCSSNYPFNFLLLICINPPQSVFLPDCLYIFQKLFNYLLILLFTYYITTFDLCNPPPCLDLAEMNFSCKLCSHFSDYFPLSSIVLVSPLETIQTKSLWQCHTTSDFLTVKGKCHNRNMLVCFNIGYEKLNLEIYIPNGEMVPIFKLGWIHTFHNVRSKIRQNDLNTVQ